MVVFPNAKINLGLNVVEKRPDGFHNIETVFYPIPLQDILEFQLAEKVAFKSSGIEIPHSTRGNLVVQAYQLLATDFKLPPVEFLLHKIIPIGAGLGGGSADASFALKALNDFFKLNCTEIQLEIYAAKLGSDCPFFIRNIPVYAEGKGDQFSPIDLSLKGMNLLLVNPGIHVSTQVAYAGVTPQKSEKDLKKILKSSINNWKTELKNDFEKSVFKVHPQLAQIKQEMYDLGAIYVSMSGSGSSLFALFDNKIPPKEWTGSSWKFEL